MFYCTCVLFPAHLHVLCKCAAVVLVGDKHTLCCKPQEAALQETKLFAVVLGKSSVKSFPQVPEGKRFVGRDNMYLMHTCSCLVDLVLTSVTNHTQEHLHFISRLLPDLVKKHLVPLNLVSLHVLVRLPYQMEAVFSVIVYPASLGV